MKEEINICYLCGNPIIDDFSREHVPPLQFYAKTVRTDKINLLTVPTHKKCNNSYQLDEEYFIHTLVPLAMDTYSGSHLLEHLFTQQYKKNRNIPLSKKVLSEFDKRPSGLHLPKDKVVKYFEPERVWRVVWKITRELFFHEYKVFLPDNIPNRFDIISPGETPPEEFEYIAQEPSRGQYPGVFDYKYKKFEMPDNFHMWAMLFWDKIITIVYFHDPKCSCEKCQVHQ